MELIKVTNEWMQELKLRIYDADNYKIKKEDLENQKKELIFKKEFLDRVHKSSKRRFIILCILSFGILYYKKKDNVTLLDEVFSKVALDLSKNIEKVEDKIEKLDYDKSNVEEIRKYYNQIEQFLTLVRQMSNEEKEQYLKLKI